MLCDKLTGDRVANFVPPLVPRLRAVRDLFRETTGHAVTAGPWSFLCWYRKQEPCMTSQPVKRQSPNRRDEIPSREEDAERGFLPAVSHPHAVPGHAISEVRNDKFATCSLYRAWARCHNENATLRSPMRCSIVPVLGGFGGLRHKFSPGESGKNLGLLFPWISRSVGFLSISHSFRLSGGCR